MDARALAEDFSKALLKHEIALAASDDTEDDQTVTLEDRYMLLNQLLSSNKYQTVERNCSITLTASEKNEENHMGDQAYHHTGK